MKLALGSGSREGILTHLHHSHIPKFDAELGPLTQTDGNLL